MVQLANARLGRTLAVYASASFVVLQVVDLFQDRLELPDWVFPAALVLLLIGLPIVLVTAVVETNELKSRLLERHFTWKRSLTLGAAAFAVLTLSAGTYVASRTFGFGPAASLVSSGVLNQSDVVLMQSFDAPAADSSLATMFAEAARLSLNESDKLRVATPEQVREQLLLMKQPRDVAIRADVAKEIAVRLGAKALVAGSISKVGSGYVLNLSLTDPRSGNALAAYRETANDADGLIEAMDGVTRRLRRKIGDSLKELRHEPPLARATTTSLEALQRFTSAIHAVNTHADNDRAVALLQEAIAIDSTFASAYRMLGTSMINRGDPQGAANAMIAKAYQYRDRLSPREKIVTNYTYMANVEGEWCKAGEMMEDLLQRGDTNFNSIGYAYAHCARSDLAEKYLRLAIARPKPSYHPFSNLSNVLIRTGQLNAADSVAEKLRAIAPGNPRYPRIRGETAINREQYDSARHWANQLIESRTPAARAEGLYELALVDLLQGRIQAAARNFTRLEKLHVERNVKAAALNARLHLAITHAIGGNPQQAREEIAGALRDYPRAGFEPIDWPYTTLSYAYFILGNVDMARTTLEAAFREEHPGTLKGNQTTTRINRMMLALTRNAPGEALTLSADTAGIGCTACPLPLRGRAFELTGQTDSAIATYERFITRASPLRHQFGAMYLGDSYERLGALHEKRGDIESAKKYYGKLVALWGEGEGQPRRRAESAARRIALLSRR